MRRALKLVSQGAVVSQPKQKLSQCHLTTTRKTTIISWQTNSK